MTAPDQEVVADLRLPDGRTVAGTSHAEALTLWREIFEEDCYGGAASQLKAGDLVLDIGANIGLASMRFGNAAPDVHVVAVEPAPRTFACLKLNLQRSGVDGTAVRAAVMASSGTTSFTYYPNAPGNSSAFADPSSDDATTRAYLRNLGVDDDEYVEELLADLHSGEHLVVPALTVADLLSPYEGRHVGVLKVDVEGAELEVLRGLSPENWNAIRYVVAEVHDVDGRLEAVTALLVSAGLSVATAQPSTLRGTQLYLVDAARTNATV